MRGRIAAGVGIGVGLSVVGGIALAGAVEALEYSAGAETIAQAFLVPLTLFGLAGVAIHFAHAAWRGRD